MTTTTTLALRCSLSGAANLHANADANDGIVLSYGQYNADKRNGGHAKYPLQYTVTTALSPLDTARTLRARLLPNGTLRASGTSVDVDAVCVSTGNDKLGNGKVWNMSLMGGQSCIPGAPCLKDCYDLANCRIYRDTALEARQRNQRIHDADIDGFWTQMRDNLRKWRQPFARPFQGGDMIVKNGDSVDVDKSKQTIRQCWATVDSRKDLAWGQYTKAWAIPELRDALNELPDHHNLLLSTGWGMDWPNLADYADNVAIAVVTTGQDEYAELIDWDSPETYVCPCDNPADERSKCAECGNDGKGWTCYRLQELGIKVIVFYLQDKWAKA